MTKLTVAFRNFAKAANKNHKENLKRSSNTKLYCTVIGLWCDIKVYFGVAQYVLELEGLVSILPVKRLLVLPILLKNKALLALRRILGDAAYLYL
jgi:hypothetical protein